MITCGHCGLTMPEESFTPSRRRRGNLCRRCIYERTRRVRAEGNEIVAAEKLRRGACVDCGLIVTPENLVVFDFDHRNRAEKTGSIGALKGKHSTLRGELEKCDLRCANCHRLKTHRGEEFRPMVGRKARGARSALPAACFCCGTMHSRASAYCSGRCLMRANYRLKAGIPLDAPLLVVRRSAS